MNGPLGFGSAGGSVTGAGWGSFGGVGGGSGDGGSSGTSEERAFTSMSMPALVAIDVLALSLHRFSGDETRRRCRLFCCLRVSQRLRP
jgi:hypothetical protein